MRTAEYPKPERTLLHLSDTHLRAGGSRLFDLVDAASHLERRNALSLSVTERRIYLDLDGTTLESDIHARAIV